MKLEKMKSRQELADELGISSKTLNRWLKKYRVDVPKGLISPLQQQRIKQLLGVKD